MPSFKVDSPGPLLSCLFAHLEGWKRNTVKKHLRGGGVRVNGVVNLRHDHPVEVGDEIAVGDAAPARVRHVGGKGLHILHMDSAFVAVDKPAGLLSVATPSETRRTAMQRLRDQLRATKGAGASKLWPVHRLDRETSGVLLFARSYEVKQALNAAWPSVQKTYLAVVHGQLESEAGTVDRPLIERDNLYVYVSKEDPRSSAARDAITHYRRVATSAGRSLVEVDIETGRKHQIRVHMASLGHPIIGDTRYGGEPWRSRIALHAAKIVLPHPVTGETIMIETERPVVFDTLVPQ